MTGGDKCFILFCCAWGVGVTAAITYGITSTSYETSAIKAGVAEYRITEPTNPQSVEFQWIKPKTQEMNDE